MGVGFPATLLLHEFGAKVWDAFGYPPYHVGSSLQNKVWRDVDVRLLLADPVYETWGFGKPDACMRNAKWVAMCLAFSTLGQKMTGLPIDFQIQQLSWANEKFQGPRGTLGLIPGKIIE